MSNNFSDFEKSLSLEMKEVEEGIEQDLKNVALDFLDYVTAPPPQGTPVDTGYTTNSWHISIGHKTTNTIGEPSTYDGALTAKRRQEESVTELESTKGLENLEAIYINNNNDHISDLNSGSSTQNPGGFVELGIQFSSNNVR